MSGDRDMARREADGAGTRARPLYLELRALDLDLWVEEDTGDPTGYRIVAEVPVSLPRLHLEGLMLRVRDNKVGLIEMLLCPYDADLHAIRREGSYS